MWETKCIFTLPPGFRLLEDEDCAYLYDRDKQVAVFSRRADPKEIQKEAKKLLKLRLH